MPSTVESRLNRIEGLVRVLLGRTTGSGSPLTVKEIDGSPSVANVTEIKVTNGALTDNGGGSTTITIGAGTLADGDYGDITVGGTGTTMTIDAEAVTYAKMQHVSATDKILGRSTAGAGDVEEIACTAAGRALLDDAAASNQCTTLGLGTGDGPTFDHLHITNQADAATVHATTILTDHLGEHTGSHSIILDSAAEAADHGTAATDQIVNVCYGTGAAPAANTTTEGALWIKYTA